VREEQLQEGEFRPAISISNPTAVALVALYRDDEAPALATRLDSLGTNESSQGHLIPSSWDAGGGIQQQEQQQYQQH
jgi:hypothetical protein